jgi:hypothetical protein
MNSTLSDKSTNIYTLYNSNMRDRLIKLITKILMNKNVSKIRLLKL